MVEWRGVGPQNLSRWFESSPGFCSFGSFRCLAPLAKTVRAVAISYGLSFYLFEKFLCTATINRDNARVAELADAKDLRSFARKSVWVRPPPRAPRWKSQCLAPPSAGLGHQIVRIFRGKKKFPIPLKAEKKNFHKDLRVKKWPEIGLFLFELALGCLLWSDMLSLN